MTAASSAIGPLLRPLPSHSGLHVSRLWMVSVLSNLSVLSDLPGTNPTAPQVLLAPPPPAEIQLLGYEFSLGFVSCPSAPPAAGHLHCSFTTTLPLSTFPLSFSPPQTQAEHPSELPKPPPFLSPLPSLFLSARPGLPASSSERPPSLSLLHPHKRTELKTFRGLVSASPDSGRPREDELEVKEGEGFLAVPVLSVQLPQRPSHLPRLLPAIQLLTRPCRLWFLPWLPRSPPRTEASSHLPASRHLRLSDVSRRRLLAPSSSIHPTLGSFVLVSARSETRRPLPRRPRSCRSQPVWIHPLAASNFHRLPLATCQLLFSVQPAPASSMASAQALHPDSD